MVRQARVGAHPLDADRAGAGADVPEELARGGHQAGEGGGAEVALGELAVVLEGVVREARCPGGEAVSRNLEGDDVQRRRVRRPRRGDTRHRRLGRGAQVAEHGHARTSPSPTRSAARPPQPGVDASDDSTSTRRPGARARNRSSIGRPTSETTSQDSKDHPIRARASATDDTAGTTSTGTPRSSKVVAIPDTNGSPDASATTSRPAYSESSAGSPSRSGEGHGTRS